MKPDEAELLRYMQANQKYGLQSNYPWKIAKILGMNHKRANYILGKWSDKGWYEYGVCVDSGWLTSEGMEVEV